MIRVLDAIYSSIAQPSPARPKPEPKSSTPRVTGEDVDAILAYQRSGTPEELQQILERDREFGLSTWQRNKLGLALSIAVAAKFRQGQGECEDATSPFLRSIGAQETPAGLLFDAKRFPAELKRGIEGIMACRRHKPTRCQCWRDSRDRLYAIREHWGERSPEAWGAVRVWEILEDLEVKIGGRSARTADND